jgi:hypothetical protein
MNTSFEHSVSSIIEGLENSRPEHCDGSNLFFFLNDLANFAALRRLNSSESVSELQTVYRAIHDERTDPTQWTAGQYIQTLLAHRDTHTMFEMLKSMKQKGASVPDILLAVADDVMALGELPIQNIFDKTSEQLINLALVLDFTRSQNFDTLLRPQREKIKQASERLIKSLTVIAPDFNSIADRSYRKLGYFELDPFSKRISIDDWVKTARIESSKPEPNMRVVEAVARKAHFQFGEAFRPRLDNLPGGSMRVIHALLADDTPISKDRLIEKFGISAQPQSTSELSQAVAQLVEIGAVSETDGQLRVRGDEFADWYRATHMPRRQRQGQTFRISLPEPAKTSP